MIARRAAELSLAMGFAAGCAAPNPSASTSAIEMELPPLQTTGSGLQSTHSYSGRYSGEPFEPPQYPRWSVGQPLLQGYFGASILDRVTVSQGGNVEVDGDDGSLDQMPVIGGGAQWKLAGDDMTLGLECMFAFSGRANAEAFAFGGAGAVIAIDVDLLLFDIYGGPFVSIDLGDDVRIYGAGGPVMQFAEWDQSFEEDIDSGDGFGTGLYARTGIEFMLPNGDFIGFGVRWSETTVDLGGGLGDLEMEGVQFLFTVSRWE